MISIWQMVRGRVVGAVVAGLLIFLGWLGLAEISGEGLDTLTALANAFVNFLGFVGYAIYHQWNTRRTLNKEEIVVENLLFSDRRRG